MGACDILLVEDDTDLRTLLTDLLRRDGLSVYEAGDAAQMEAQFALSMPELVILDINLPGEDGLSICRRLAANTGVSILMLTARSEDVDRIIGLEIGADDYVGKPFNPRELLARVRALLRRRQKVAAGGLHTIVRAAGFEIATNARTVRHIDGREIVLSGAEFDLFLILAEAKGRVLSRDYLLDRIHGRTAHPFDRSIDVLVSRLRKKIDTSERTLIEAIRGAGYVLREPSA